MGATRPLGTTDNADWIQIELDYRLGELTLEELAAQHDVPINSIEKRALEGDWHDGYGVGAVHPKYVRFVDEYMIDWDRRAAAVRAGVNEVNIDKFMRNKAVRELLQQRIRESSIRTRVSHDSVLLALNRLAMVDIRKFYDDNGRLKAVHELDEDCAFALASIEVDEWKTTEGATVQSSTKKIKLIDRLAALRDIGKHLGMYDSKLQLTGKDGGPVEVKESTPNDAARRIAFVLMMAAQQKGDTNES